MDNFLQAEKIPVEFRVPLSIYDKKLRLIKLFDSLTVLLISDPKLTSFSASITARTGSFNDPLKVPGLAHLCEHTIFSSLIKFRNKLVPFHEAVLDCNGDCNAYTKSELTSFQFKVPTSSIDDDEPFFYKLLEEFCKILRKTSFKKTHIKEQIDCINSEHTINLASKEKIFLHVIRKLIDPNHPYSRFATGNKATFTNIPINKLKKELSEYFVSSFKSSKIFIVIQGNSSLNQLQKLALRSFHILNPSKSSEEKIPNSLIRNKNEQLYSIFNLGKFVYIIDNSQNLRITFPIPISEPIKRCFERAWCDIIGSEIENSLIYELKKLSYASYLITYTSKISSQVDILILELNLTRKGLQFLNNVLIIIFNYLDFLKKIDVKIFKKYLQQLSTIEKLNFYFSPQCEDELDQMAKLGEFLAEEIKKENVIQGFHSFEDEENDWKSIASCFLQDTREIFRSDNCSIIIFCNTNKSFQDFTSPLTNMTKDEYFQFEYQISSFSSNHLKQGNIIIPLFKFQNPNPYLNYSYQEMEILISLLSKRFHSRTETELGLIKSNSKLKSYPILFDSSKNHEIWLKSNVEDEENFRVTVSFQYDNQVSFKNVKNLIVVDLISRLIGKRLQTILYPAELVGYTWSIFPVVNGNLSIGFNVTGLLQGILSVIKTIMREIKMTLDSISTIPYNEWVPLRVGFRKDLEDMTEKAGIHQIVYGLRYCLEENIYALDKRLEALEETDVTDILDVSNEFSGGNVFSTIFVQGDFKDQTKIQLLRTLINEINISKNTQGSGIAPGSYLIPMGRKFQIKIKGSKSDHSNTVNVYIQIGLRESDYSRTIAKLLSFWISTLAVLELRTKQNLGYQVYSGQRIFRNTIGIYISVVSGSFTSEQLIFRIEEFLYRLERKIAAMNDIKFETTIVDPFLKNYKNPSILGCGSSNFNFDLQSNIGSGIRPGGNDFIEHMNYWEKITSRTFRFEGVNGEEEIDEEIVSKLDKREFLEIYKRHCSPFSNARSSLTFSVEGIAKINPINSKLAKYKLMNRNNDLSDKEMKAFLKRINLEEIDITKLHQECHIVR